MAIAAHVDTLENVPEEQQSLYKQNGEEGYILDVTETKGFVLENVTSLKGALTKERTANTESKAETTKLKSEVTKLTSKVEGFGDLSRDKFDEMSTELKTFKDKDINADVEKMAQTLTDERVSKITKKHEKETSTLISERDAKTKKIMKNLELSMIDNAAQRAIVENGGDDKTVKLLLPHVKQRAKLRESDDNYIVDVLGDDGNVMVGNDGNNFNLSQLVADMKSGPTFAATFPSTGTSGGGTQSTQTNTTTQSSDPLKKSKMNIKEKSDFIASHTIDEYLDIPD